MKNKILIQFGINEKRLGPVIKAAQKTGIDYDFFSYYKESKIIDDFPQDFLEKDWLSISSIPAVLYSSKRDPVYYKTEKDFQLYNEHFIDSYFGVHTQYLEQEHIFSEIANGSISYLPMLNEGAKFQTMDSLKGVVAEQDTFLKPNSIFKEFLGGVWNKGESFEEFLIRRQWGGKDAGVMICPASKIHSEYRFFVINGIPVTGSSYIYKNKLDIKAEISDEIWSEANRLGALYCPAKAFTLDLCLLENGEIKIVEYNGFTSSGTYNCDLTIVFDNLINSKIKNTLKKT